MISKRLVFLAQQGKCFYCGRYLSPWAWEKDNTMGWTIDHFYPKSKKIPPHYRDKNKVFSCRECNCKKGNRGPTAKEAIKHKSLYSLLDRM